MKLVAKFEMNDWNCAFCPACKYNDFSGNYACYLTGKSMEITELHGKKEFCPLIVESGIPISKKTEIYHGGSFKTTANMEKEIQITKNLGYRLLNIQIYKNEYHFFMEKEIE